MKFAISFFLVVFSMLISTGVLADAAASWTIVNGPLISGSGLDGTYPSASSACQAWYQYWQSTVAQYGGSATYQNPYVVVNTDDPASTSEMCSIPVSAFGSAYSEESYLLRTPSCQANETFDPDSDECLATNVDNGKNAGDAGDCNGGVGAAVDNKVACQGTTMATDPINTATGNKFQQDTDFKSSDWLTFRRFYNSVPVLSSTLGPQWRHSFDRFLSIQKAGSTGGTVSSIRMYRPDGSSEPFRKVGGVWKSDADVADTLAEQDGTSGSVVSYTVFIAPRREYEQYSASGLLQSITNASGQTSTLTYSTANTSSSIAPSPGLLLTVTDPSGRQLNFTYNDDATLAQVKQPDGGALTYAYDSITGNLVSVQYPDGKILQYVYNESSLNSGSSQSSILTGVIDETAARYASTGYSSAGKAISFTLAGGANVGAITYGSGSATLKLPLGVATNLTTVNDGLGMLKLSGASTSCGSQCTQPWQQQTYDANGYPASYTDFVNVVTQTAYDAYGLLDQQIDASGTSSQRTTNTTWNTTLRVPLTRTVLNASGATMSSTQWVYNTRGQTLARCEIDPTNSAASGYACAATGTVPAGVRRWTYTYCNAVDATQCPLVGLLLTAVGPRTNLTQTTAYSYYLSNSAVSCGTPGAACHQLGDLHTVTDALGHTTTFVSYDADGRVTRATDANGVNTDLTYTPRGWLASRTVGGAATQFSYTAYGAVQTVTDPDGVKTTYGYDTAHRLTKVTDALGNYVQYTLDAAGNKTAEQVYDASNVLHQKLTRTFNTLGQLTTVVDGLGHTVFNASASGNYDANGNLVLSSDGLGIRRQQGYDALNRLVQTLDNYNGTNTATANTKTQYGYDSLDRLTQVTDPSNLATTYSYDGLSDATSQISPDTGATSRTFDAAGNVLTRTDAKGVTATSTYDALDRLIGTTYPDSTQNVAYHYDEANSVTGCSTSVPIGRLTRIVETAVTTAYCYDTQGRVIEKRQTTGTTTDTTGYTYTAAGRLNELLYPSGTLATYTRDGDGRIQSIALTPPHGAASTVVNNMTYLPFGPVKGYTLGNGQVVSRTYDANYRLTDLASPAFTLHLARDAMGDVTAIGNAAGASPATETYGYDPLYRLATITEAGGTILESATYNPTGDRLSKTGSGLATGAYSYKPNTHQLVATGSAARTVDANGNTTAIRQAGAAYGFGYNDRNRMAVAQLGGSTVASYTYNAVGERIQKVAGTATERYDYDEDQQLLSELGTTHRDYVWMGGIPVANVDTTGTTSTLAYVTADQLGTPRAISNSAGTTVWQLPYQGNAFEELQPTSTTSYTYNLRSAGEYYDVETGLNSNGYRTRDPNTWRFLQSDPLGLDGGISTYGAVGNDPLGSVDILGLFGVPPEDEVSSEAMNTPETNAEIARQNEQVQESAREAQWERDVASGKIPPRGAFSASEFGSNGVCRAPNAEDNMSTVGPPGYRPPVPEGWLPRLGRKPGNIKWVNPENQHDYVRVKPDGTVTQVRDGMAYDVNGNRVPLDASEAHGITPGDFTFRP